MNEMTVQICKNYVNDIAALLTQMGPCLNFAQAKNGAKIIDILGELFKALGTIVEAPPVSNDLKEQGPS